jgi:Transposase DNA-binding/Transposase DDE domain
MELSEYAVQQVGNDFLGTKLGDLRRSKRAGAIAASLSRKPSASLPEALGDDAAVQAAYRFMNSDEVSFGALLEAHAQKAAQRAGKAQSAKVLHDTTDATFSHLDPNDIGYLPTNKPGFLIHLSLLLDGDRWRHPQGVIHAETIHRKQRSKHAGKKRSGRQTVVDPDGEGMRWWRGIEAAEQRLKDVPEVIHVADRESDSYELMHRCLEAGYRFVFRARVPDRRGRTQGNTSWSTVKTIAEGCAGIVEREVVLSTRAKRSAPGMNRGNPPRNGRNATLRFSAIRVELARPQYMNPPFAQTISINLVHVIEQSPPEGEQPVQWLLYTTEPIDTAEQVAKIVDIYRARWTIEEFNAALKTGCAYEARQFTTKHALLNILALSLPVACELLALRSHARDRPQAPAIEVLRPSQIDVLRALGQKIPAAPTAREALLAVAALGGHLKRNGEPGWNTLMRGMRTLLDYEKAWVAGRASILLEMGAPHPSVHDS